MRRILILIGFILLTSLSARAQGFVSGSTGADGPLDLTPGNLTVQLPASGVLNYTTVNIPSGRILNFTPNLRNTPVIMLAQGNVTIAGSISVSAVGSGTGTPGPGGFYGGGRSQPGFGPLGGQPGTATKDGKWVGPLSLVPIIGGSGGAGNSDFSGGSGGGAIVIASSTTIAISGAILASGTCFGGDLGSGAGGAIRVVANSVSVSGQLASVGACSPFNIANTGVIRLEAPTGAMTFTGTSNPPAVSSTINPVIVPNANTASMTIASIGGFPVPSYSGSVPGRVDLLLPTALTDPINLVVQASNIPVGTQVMMNITGSTGATYTPATLSGSLASSTATLAISGLNRSASSYFFVYALFDPPTSAPTHNASGPDHVAKIRVEAAPGARPKFVFLRNDGTEIELAKVSQSLRQQFEQ